MSPESAGAPQPANRGPAGDAAARFRWPVLAVFVLSTTINYLDRATLATLAPAVKADFHLSNAGYGWIVNAFLVTYTIAAPFAGLMVDRIGLNLAATLAVGLWSCAGIATGFTRGIAGLCACRAVLGAAEAAGIPAAGKAIHQYLKPAERALGNAANQTAVSLGMVLAPPIATWIAVRSGWRHAFVVTGALGLLWIPIWMAAGRRSRARGRQRTAPVRRLRPPARPSPLGFRAGQRPQHDPLFAVGEFHHALFRGGPASHPGARRVVRVDSAGAGRGRRLGRRLVVAALDPFRTQAPRRPPPRLPGGRGAGAGHRRRARRAQSLRSPRSAFRISFFAVAAFSVNMYSLPLDVFGGARAAFAVSFLTASAGASGFLSPAFGWLIDRHGYAPVTGIAALAPLAAWAVLYAARDTA